MQTPEEKTYFSQPVEFHTSVSLYFLGRLKRAKTSQQPLLGSAGAIKDDYQH